MIPILRFATSTTALTAQSTLDSASAWASDHPTVTLAVLGTMVAVTAITAAIRALRRYLRLALPLSPPSPRPSVRCAATCDSHY